MALISILTLENTSRWSPFTKALRPVHADLYAPGSFEKNLSKTSFSPLNAAKIGLISPESNTCTKCQKTQKGVTAKYKKIAYTPRKREKKIIIKIKSLLILRL